ncbi:CGNR zinc finger domain-containing protein [Streptomyces sp. NPDC050560]|uniref:CGNR zinc finger domain-containing protein n=1 Tax=Streptomyces sp. NPDC050560 TaxID=3365630 RepID=UPI00379C9D89
MTDSAQEDALLELLNTTPVVDGAPVDRLADAAAGRAWLRERDGRGSEAERRAVREVRDLLQQVVRGQRTPRALAPALDGVSWRPSVRDQGLDWLLDAPAERRYGARMVLTWFQLHGTRPGRLRPCANDECLLFLLDRSKANTARWCSMAACGNRMKARRHHQRTRSATAG